MVVDIEKYLSEEEIKQIAIQEVREAIREKLKSEKEVERILGNLSYHMVWEEIDKLIPGYKEMIATKVKSALVDKDYTYNIFRAPSAWDKEASLGWRYMQEAINSNKGIIEDKIRENIANKDYSEDVWNLFEKLSEDFMGNIYALTELLRKK